MYWAAGGYEAELGVTTSVFRCCVCVCVCGGGEGGKEESVNKENVNKSIKKLLKCKKPLAIEEPPKNGRTWDPAFC